MEAGREIAGGRDDAPVRVLSTFDRCLVTCLAGLIVATPVTMAGLRAMGVV